MPAATAAPSGGTPVAFVSAERASQLVAVDLTTGKVIARIRTPAGPHNVAEQVRWVIVTSPPAGAVTLVDAFSLRTAKVFRGFGYAHDVEVEGRYAYVTDEARGQVAVIDLAGRRVVARIAVGPRPHDLAATATRLLVTHGPRASSLTVVDVEDPGRPRVAGRLAAGGPSHDISEQPDTATAYLTYWGSGSVAALDWGRGRLLWRRHVGALVHHVAFDPFQGRRVWASDHGADRAYLVRSSDGRLLGTVEGCPGAHHVALTPRQAAIACHDSDSLLVLAQGTGRARSIPVGAGPHGVAVAVLP